MQNLSYFPGQKVTIVLPIHDGYGSRINSISLPTVERVIFPGMTLASNYPQSMIQIDIGLYYYNFILPIGAAAIGDYLVDISYVEPIRHKIINELYQITVSAPYGNFGMSIS